MFAGHAAAGLALSGRARRLPVVAFVVAAFALDVLWIGLAVTGLDRSPGSDWSHSLLMAVLWSGVAAALSWRAGRHVVLAIGAAVFSHFLLDLLIQGAALYPGAPPALLAPVLVHRQLLAVQIGLCLVLLAVFVRDAWLAGTPRWRIVAASAVVLLLNGR